MLTVSDNHIVLGGGGGGGGGDVVGASSSTDNAIARFDGTTGKLVQNSGVKITDAGMVGIGTTPSELLDIYTSTGSSKILLQAPNGSALIRLKGILSSDWQVGTDVTTGDFLFRDQANLTNPVYIQRNSAANSLYIKSPGDIGIGLTSPSAKLDVNGTFRSRGTAIFNSQIIDNVGSSGTDGQVLKKVGGLVLWSNP